MSSSALNQVTFTPPQAVTYQPNATKQCTDVTLLNKSDQAITFKWKSTRPGMYKMRPVYGIIQPNEKFTTKLNFKGLKPNIKCPMRDRFTCVLAVAPSNISNTQKMWKDHKFQEALANAEMKKKRLAILYVGVNDHLPLPKSDEEDSEKGKKGMVKKGKGLADDEDKKGAAVVLMFRERAPEEESKSDDEEDDDEPKPAGVKPGAPVTPGAAGAAAGPAKDDKKADGTPAAGTPGGPGPAPDTPALDATTAPMKNQDAAPAPAPGTPAGPPKPAAAKTPAGKTPAQKTPAAKTPAKK